MLLHSSVDSCVGLLCLELLLIQNYAEFIDTKAYWLIGFQFIRGEYFCNSSVQCIKVFGIVATKMYSLWFLLVCNRLVYHRVFGIAGSNMYLLLFLLFWIV